MSKTRYVATVTFYTYGEDATEGLQEALDVCAEINDKHDAQASVEKLHRQPFGTLASEEIDVNEIKLNLIK